MTAEKPSEGAIRGTEQLLWNALDYAPSKSTIKHGAEIIDREAVAPAVRELVKAFSKFFSQTDIGHHMPTVKQRHEALEVLARYRHLIEGEGE